MEGDRRLSLTVGLLVVSALAAFAVAVLSLSQEGVLRRRYDLVSYFGNVQGLIGGAPVWLAGKQVGRVETVTFGPLGAALPPVEVRMRIDEDVQDRIRSDSRASIGTIGLLGDRYVEISLGSTDGEVLQQGDRLDSIDPVDLYQVAGRGTEALDNITELTGNLNAVIGEFQQAQGGERLAQSVNALGDIAMEIREGSGLLHGLIYEESGDNLATAGRSLEILESILREIRDGEGVVHTLIYDAPTEQDIVLETLEAGAKLNSILAKVDSGQGTLGLMVNDPTLYEDLKELVGGAGRSRLVRTMVDMSVEEGD